MSTPKLEEKYTYQDYLTWDDGHRWELINGIPYAMSPAPGRQHQAISIKLAALFVTHLEGKTCEPFAAPFDVRFKNEQNEEDTVVQPDLSIICDPSKLDERGCLGAPDLIVEILSPATASRDLKEKLKLYESHGVQEYWVIEPNDKILFVYTLNKKGIYDRAEIYNADDTVQSQAVTGLKIKLDKIFYII